MKALNCRYPGLKEWCESHNISASVLAERSGICIATAQRLIYYGCSTGLDTAQLISDAFDLSMDYLFRVKNRKKVQTMIHLTDNDISYIRTMYKQAKDPQKQIDILADMYVCTKDEIRQVLGLPIVERTRRQQYTKWTPKLDNLLLELQRDGKTNCEIAELIGTTEGSVCKRALRLRAKAKKPPATREAASDKKINTFSV